MSNTIEYRIEIDIGCGLGTFTLALAGERPLALVIGIDVNEESFIKCENQKRSQGIKNAHFVHAEARDYIEQFVRDKSVSDYHLYFPTPWVGGIRNTNILAGDLNGWLFGPPLLAELLRTAAPGARLRLVTDHDSYFEYACKIVGLAGLGVQEWQDPIRRKPIGDLIGTGCERRQRSLGRSIRYLQCLLK